jgi:hypothetical protein
MYTVVIEKKQDQEALPNYAAKSTNKWAKSTNNIFVIIPADGFVSIFFSMSAS